MLFEYVVGGELFTYLRNAGKFNNSTGKLNKCFTHAYYTFMQENYIFIVLTTSYFHCFQFVLSFLHLTCIKLWAHKEKIIIKSIVYLKWRTKVTEWFKRANSFFSVVQSTINSRDRNRFANVYDKDCCYTLESWRIKNINNAVIYLNCMWLNVIIMCMEWTQQIRKKNNDTDR